MRADVGIPERVRPMVALLVIAGSFGCGSSTPTAANSASKTIGRAGGSLAIAGRVTLVVPALALTMDQTIKISDAGPAPASYAHASDLFHFEPAGLKFAVPAQVILAVPVRANDPGVYWSREAGSGFDPLGGTVAGGLITASVQHFSDGFVADLGGTSSAAAADSSGGSPSDGAAADGPTADVTDARPEAPPDAPVELAADRSSSDGTSGDADISTPLGFCEALEQLRGDYERRCYGIAVLEPDVTRRPPCAAFAASVASGGVGFDPTKAGACLQAYDGLACPGEHDQGLPACAAVTPRLAVSATCNPLVLFGECAGSARCVSTPGRCAGTCVAYVAPGGACAQGVSGCAPGAACINSVCTESAPAALGQVCALQEAIPCQEGLFCDHDAYVAADGGLVFGLCNPQKTSGACDISLGGCALPASCHLQSSDAGTLDTECVTGRALGASCVPGRADCQGGLWCGPDDQCTDVLLPVGADCSGLTNPEQTSCAAGAYCSADGKVCTAYTKPGDPCASDAECGPYEMAVCEALTNKCQSCQ